MDSRKRLRVLTLGCSKNTVDTEHLLSCLGDEKYLIVDDPRQGADILLINTCGFIGDAKQESVNAILEAVKLKERGEFGSIAVFGCLSERYKDELPSEIPEVDAWFGARDLDPVLEWLGVKRSGRMTSRRLGAEAPYAYLKISEGCDRRVHSRCAPLRADGRTRRRNPPACRQGHKGTHSHCPGHDLLWTGPLSQEGSGGAYRQTFRS